MADQYDNTNSGAIWKYTSDNPKDGEEDDVPF